MWNKSFWAKNYWTGFYWHPNQSAASPTIVIGYSPTKVVSLYATKEDLIKVRKKIIKSEIYNRKKNDFARIFGKNATEVIENVEFDVLPSADIIVLIHAVYMHLLALQEDELLIMLAALDEF